MLANDFVLKNEKVTSLENKFNYYVASYLACFCSLAYSAADAPDALDAPREHAWGPEPLKNALIRPVPADDKPRGLGYKMIYNNGEVLLAFKGTSFDYIRKLLAV